MSEEAMSCVQTAKGPIQSQPAPSEAGSPIIEKEIQMQVARVSKEAPDFEAGAFHTRALSRTSSCPTTGGSGL